MVYCTSDLHGIAPERLEFLLKKVDFCDDDELFVLGDVIDRGEHSVELIKWLMSKPNVNLILGNHEAMLLSCSFIFAEITEESISALDELKIELLNNWIANGADTTLKALRKLKKEDINSFYDIIDYLRDLPLYDTVSVGEKDFILIHAGFDNFSENKKMSDYEDFEILWTRPKLTDEYFTDFITVFGHTPTFSFGEEYNGKIIKTKTWVNIDTSPNPCLLRLDDMKEFYM